MLRVFGEASQNKRVPIQIIKISTVIIAASGGE
jgi:hypothetical protein